MNYIPQPPFAPQPQDSTEFCYYTPEQIRQAEEAIRLAKEAKLAASRGYASWPMGAQPGMPMQTAPYPYQAYPQQMPVPYPTPTYNSGYPQAGQPMHNAYPQPQAPAPYPTPTYNSGYPQPAQTQPAQPIQARQAPQPHENKLPDSGNDAQNHDSVTS